MRSAFSLFLIAALCTALVGCQETDDRLTYITPSGYAPPGAVNATTWEERADFPVATLLPTNPTPPAVAAAGHKPLRRGKGKRGRVLAKASQKIRAAKSRRQTRP